MLLLFLLQVNCGIPHWFHYLPFAPRTICIVWFYHSWLAVTWSKFAFSVHQLSLWAIFGISHEKAAKGGRCTIWSNVIPHVHAPMFHICTQSTVSSMNAHSCQRAYMVVSFLFYSHRGLIRDKSKPITMASIRSILSDVCEGLAHLHAHGIIHRDMKPANVLLNHENRAFIADFGMSLHFFFPTIFSHKILPTTFLKCWWFDLHLNYCRKFSIHGARNDEHAVRHHHLHGAGDVHGARVHFLCGHLQPRHHVCNTHFLVRETQKGTTMKRCFCLMSFCYK